MGSLICVACTIGLLLLFGVAATFVVGILVIVAVAYALVGLIGQHKHRPGARFRH